MSIEYERELRRPIRSLLSGQIAKLVLIQVRVGPPAGTFNIPHTSPSPRSFTTLPHPAPSPRVLTLLLQSGPYLTSRALALHPSPAFSPCFLTPLSRPSPSPSTPSPKQLQFVKKELLEAMQAIDELFNANQVLPLAAPSLSPLSHSHSLLKPTRCPLFLPLQVRPFHRTHSSSSPRRHLKPQPTLFHNSDPDPDPNPDPDPDPDPDPSPDPDPDPDPNPNPDPDPDPSPEPGSDRSGLDRARRIDLDHFPHPLRG